jgi:hypothetical protein
MSGISPFKLLRTTFHRFPTPEAVRGLFIEIVEGWYGGRIGGEIGVHDYGGYDSMEQGIIQDALTD